VDRDGAFTLYLKDASGNLVYEFSTYWHNKTDDCVPEDDHDPEEGDKGDDKNSDDSELDPAKSTKYCNEYAKKIADAEEYMEKAQEKYDEADELEEEGDSKKAAKKRAEGDALVAKANQKYTEAGIQCDLANDYGTCACSTDPGWEDEEEEETPGGGDGGLVCDLNGDGDGQPVFLLTSTATRNVYRATQRMRVTMDETLSKVWRISWSAD
jgi:hypothetical protein